MMRWAAIVLVIVALGAGATACGGDDEGAATTTEETTTETTDTTATAAGREIFVANCGSCHTLSDAGTTGNIGPNLDEIDVSTAEVEDQVRNGGGGMPAFGDELSDMEIQEVAAYVVAARGS